MGICRISLASVQSQLECKAFLATSNTYVERVTAKNTYEWTYFSISTKFSYMRAVLTSRIWVLRPRYPTAQSTIPISWTLASASWAMHLIAPTLTNILQRNCDYTDLSDYLEKEHVRERVEWRMRVWSDAGPASRVAVKAGL